jgi:hypothetical protein
MTVYATRKIGAPDALRAAWDALRSPDGSQPYRDGGPWSDQAGHDEVLRLATQYDGYAWAAARYREVVRVRPNDAIAKRELERLRRAAEVTMLTTAIARVDRTPKPYRASIAMFVLLVMALIGGLVFVMHIGSRNSRSSNPAPNAPLLRSVPPR